MTITAVSKFQRLVATTTLIALLSACGGGSSSDSNPTQSNASLLPSTVVKVGQNGDQSTSSDDPQKVVAPPSTALQAFLSEYPASRLDQIRAAAPTKQQRIGVNTINVVPWTESLTYSDLMLHGGYFSNPSGSFGSGAPVDNGTANQAVAVGADGQPVDSFKVALLSKQTPKPSQTGNYTIAYQGQASAVSLETNVANYTASNSVVSNGWTVLTVPVSAQYKQLEVKVTFAKNNGVAISPVKNLKVLLPGYAFNPANPEATPVLYQPFINQLKPFAVLRFMDFLHTNTEPSTPNNKPPGVWAQRPTPVNKLTSLTGPFGQPWERVIQIGQAANADIWINVPPRANDEYFQRLAEFMRDNMPSGMKVYVEYGNEMWNTQFVQVADLQQEALALAAANQPGEGARINHDGIYSNNAKSAFEKTTTLSRRLYADRVARISQAFKTAFGSSFNSRVRVMLTWQVTDPLATGALLDYIQLKHGTPSTLLYATSGAPYFGLTDSAKNKAAQGTVTVNEILNAMEEDSINHEFIARYEAQVAQAKRWGLKFVAYEGGPDTYGPHALTAKRAASMSDRMFELCQAHLNRWAEAGGDLFMWFHAGAGSWDSQYGSWALVENLEDLTGPKISAMNWATITAPPKAKSRHALTVSGVDGQTTTGGLLNAGETIRPWDQPTAAETYANRESEATWWDSTHVREYLVSSAAEHDYTVSMNVTLKSNGQGTLPLDVYVNGVKQAGVSFAYSGTAGSNKKLTSPVKLRLEAGMNAITLKSTGAYYFVLNTVQFE